MSTDVTEEDIAALRKSLKPSELSTLVSDLSDWEATDSLANTSVALNARQLQAWADFAIALSENHPGVRVSRAYGPDTLVMLKPAAEREEIALRREVRRRRDNAET